MASASAGAEALASGAPGRARAAVCRALERSKKHFAAPDRTTLLLASAFLALSLAHVAQIAHHTTWRDEFQAWLIALESNSLSQLLHNMRFEGHPPLWHALLMGVSTLSHDPVTLKWLQAAIAVACLGLVLWKAPFAPGLRILVALNYAIFFEYAVFARPYGLGVLLLLAALVLWRSWLGWLLLGLMCHISLHFMLLAGLLGVFRIFRRGWSMAGAALLALLAGSALWCMRPDAAVVPAINSGSYAVSAFRAMLGAGTVLQPLTPSLGTGGWFFHSHPAFMVVALLSVLALVMVLWRLFTGDRVKLALAFACLAALLVLGAFVYPIYARHSGVLILLVISLFWIDWTRLDEPARRGFRRLSAWLAAMGLAAGGLALAQPFAGDSIGAGWIVEQGLAGRTWAAYPGWHGITITARTGQPTFNLQRACTNTFVRWSYPAGRKLADDEAASRLAAMTHSAGGEAYLMTSLTALPEPMPGLEAQLLKELPPDQLGERVRLYRLRAAPGTASPGPLPVCPG